MPLDGSVYLDRERAESFGTVAREYDRFRPSYPDELIDDLVATAPRSVLDVGTGTGKAARLLAARGVPVLGVEIDPAMAAVARGHGIEVEIGSFEQWDDAGRTFDLITSAQAWHWVDPALAAPKAARLLNPGGRLAVFWNVEEPDDATMRALDAVYAERAPELASTPEQRAGRKAERPSLTALRASGAFRSVTEQTYLWTATIPVDELVGRLGTHSDHLQLGAERRLALQDAVRRALLARGDEVALQGGTYTVYARP